MKSVFLDTETTGTDPVKHGIIQLSGVIVVPNTTIVNDGCDERTFDLKMKPFDSDEIEESALVINGTTREELMTRTEPRAAFTTFTSLLGKCISRFDSTDKAYLFGYNVGFDDQFLRAWFKKNGDRYYGSWFWWPPIDVAVMAAIKLRDRRHELRDFKQGTVARALGIEVDETKLHDALYDIGICRQIANICMETK
jgi:DNA polymerase-3 subunit epsilon